MKCVKLRLLCIEHITYLHPLLKKQLSGSQSRTYSQCNQLFESSLCPLFFGLIMEARFLSFKEYFYLVKCYCYVPHSIRNWSSWFTNFNNHPLHASVPNTIMDIYNCVLGYSENRKVEAGKYLWRLARNLTLVMNHRKHLYLVSKILTTNKITAFVKAHLLILFKKDILFYWVYVLFDKEFSNTL